MGEGVATDGIRYAAHRARAARSAKARRRGIRAAQRSAKRDRVSKGRVTKADADRITALSPPDQVPEIFKLESQGIYFSKDLSKSIIYSVAPPGMSQHISLLALDVEQNDNGAVRAVLADHGWFQTVISDLPHFTYLGVKASELSGLGLKKSSSGGRDYWVPDI